ncbi:GNAT family N-acetyltransferase [Ktedonospora formicarum]|uniref:N-acetyltransferase domain-containing protein n=1 Tax=Ktedonospora formicarum TaxID=2778364 RepID=A0A8J3I9J8_9CHLR|nr:GNAT family N-acetyltransferase [Ktedonospora formicarum]GHO49718.1 hypothetical protein KSX_78810 [Ktedonospora formicarum]
MIHVRPYVETDREFVLGLSPRLTIGMPAWRDRETWLATFQNWITGSIDQHQQEKAMVFVAEDEQQERLGFVCVDPSTHFTGEPQADIGELVVSEAEEGRGVGKALLQACEQWAQEQGYRFISLATGAANEQALGFYRHLGYLDEDVKLVKPL